MCESGILNFNIGIVGHVDSGKTSLCRALSSTASTAAFDKNPQSKERGITLDLGFSSFTALAPDHIKDCGKYEKIQFTLVDCPGHASLIRTIIGGSQIIDLMLLVIDINKGIQTQTGECLVIGEITTKHMIIVLNKIDTIPDDKRQAAIDKMCKRLQKSLSSSPFVNAPILSVSACGEGEVFKGTSGEEGNAGETGSRPIGIAELVSTLCECAYVPDRHITPPFIMSADHCFSIRGQGTVITGTVIHGVVSINDNIEIPSIKLTRKVKSIQMFRLPVKQAIQGDRCGVCVSQFDPSLLERGLVCTPGAVPTVYAVIISVHKISYYKAACCTNAKFHISIGHETVMGKVTFFADAMSVDKSVVGVLESFSSDHVYEYCDELRSGERGQFALIEFDQSVTCTGDALVIGSKLDTDIHANTCRLAFYGRVVQPITDRGYRTTYLPAHVRISKGKYKAGVVERLGTTDQSTLICKGMFKKETNIQQFVGMTVTLSTGESGRIESAFGQSGKFKVWITGGLLPSTVSILSAREKKGKRGGKTQPEQVTGASSDSEPIRVELRFKRYIYDVDKKMIQT